MSITLPADVPISQENWLGRLGLGLGQGLQQGSQMGLQHMLKLSEQKNAPITLYQQLLASQRAQESQRKYETQVGKIMAELDIDPNNYLNVYAASLKFLREGHDVPTALKMGKEAIENPPAEEKLPPKEPVSKTKELPSLTKSQIKARYNKMPGKTHEQKIKNLKKLLEKEGYKVTGI